MRDKVFADAKKKATDYAMQKARTDRSCAGASRTTSGELPVETGNVERGIADAKKAAVSIQRRCLGVPNALRLAQESLARLPKRSEGLRRKRFKGVDVTARGRRSGGTETEPQRSRSNRG
jgi:hypothetical protein